jgi:hypothetical protein
MGDQYTYRQYSVPDEDSMQEQFERRSDINEEYISSD